MNDEQKILEKAKRAVKEKKEKYGNAVDVAVGDMMKTLYPDGIGVSEYDRAIFLVRICEKLGRVTSTKITQEGRNDAYNDIIGYGLLGLAKDEDESGGE